MTPPDLCITDFLTNGSLIRVCQAAQRLTGLSVSLLDAQGRIVAHGNSARVFAVQDAAVKPNSEDSASRTLSAPIAIGPAVIGAIAVNLPADPIDPAQRDTIDDFITHLAASVAESCDHQLQLQRRIDELGVLYKLSSMLVGATTVDAVLDSTIESAVATLNADAGTIRILDDSGKILQLRAAVGLSKAYLGAAGALPADRVCDLNALTGSVVVIPDIHNRDDIIHLDSLDTEHIKGMVSVGLIFRGQTLGLLRLYSHSTFNLTTNQSELLQSIAQQIAAAVANARLLESEADARRVKRQLILASDVQRRMLPAHLPDCPQLDIAARYESCFELGGDFYDAFAYDDKIALALGDVVGKGVPAALLMSAIRATLRAHTHNITDVDEVMALANQALCRDSLLNEFATVFLGVIDPKTLRLGYCNAGHEPPLVIRVPKHRAPTRADIDELPSGGMVLGVDPSQRYQQGVYDLQPGDVLFIYSDGLPDAMNFDAERFNKRRVRKALLNILTLDPNASADRIATHLLWERRRFTGLAHQTDDTTILVARVRNI